MLSLDPRACGACEQRLRLSKAYLTYSPANMEELSRLPGSLRKLALDRFRLLQPHLEEGRPLRPLAIKAGIT
jgi:hypothetical protein